MRSSGPRAQIAEVFAAFGLAMQERGARWYVYGGQAVLVYGRPRMTVDVDITVDAGGARAGELLTTLERHGFEALFPLPEGALAQARLLRIVHASTEVPLDVVLASGGIEEMLLAGARTIDLDGVAVPMISAEDLLALKVLAGRRKDLEDARGVLAAQAGRLDLERTRLLLAAFERSLDRPGLLAKLERLLGTGRAGKRRAPRG
jgi:predicted nucleotidyltransferase